MTAAPTAAPPVTLLLDPDDCRTLHQTALLRSDPTRGRITTDPTPHTNSAADLAHDLLHAMGRDGTDHPRSHRMPTNTAWRAVTCWTLTTGLQEVIVLRAHRLTTQRLQRLAAWRAQTGIRLVLLAHAPTPDHEQRLQQRLTLTGLAALTVRRGTHAVSSALRPATTGRPDEPPPVGHTPPLPTPPCNGAVTVRTTGRPRLNGQYHAGYTAARTWLARHPALPPHGACHREDLRLFLSRLTVLSPALETTLARVRGAQAGFLSRGLVLDIPDDLADYGGPGVTTVPFTPRVARILTTRLPHPLHAAAAAALLFTGTTPALLRLTQLTSIDEHTTRIAVDRDTQIHIGDPPGPRHMYAIPPRARPMIRAALEFRRRTPKALAHFGLFATCFGTPDLYDNLIADMGIGMPAAACNAASRDWHTAARCQQVTSSR
ncbi:hypothetical protein ACIRH0_12855 [Streptomyces sp. NPDC093675]|uniref:hypothetical protein n=1 Tax=Streptomyces sp. NPDC093675 TaxID=3366049 RepID=UPI0037FDBC25